MVLCLLVALGQSLHITFAVRNGKERIILGFFKIKDVFEVRLAKIHAYQIELFLEFYPFLVSLASKPYLIISEGFI